MSSSNSSSAIPGQIKRNGCVFTGAQDLEPLHTFKRFPIFMGCTEQDPSQDLLVDMSWEISRSSGSIQLNPLLPLEVLYAFPHNEAVGALWAEHHATFTQWMSRYQPREVFEIGGANGLLAHGYLKSTETLTPDLRWTVLDPHPRLPAHPRLRGIQGFIDHFETQDTPDAVVHTHVFEHAYQPAEFLKQIRKLLRGRGKMFFAIPDMKSGLLARYTNMLNFEHTYYMDERQIDVLLQREGFKILDKLNFKNHSLFYATECMQVPDHEVHFPNLYAENLALFRSFLDHHERDIARLNEWIRSGKGPVYLFGAHVFSQFLLANGLESSQIVSVLDNGPAKIGKRLYGTPFKVESPRVLREVESPRVILKAGAYNAEIKRDIQGNINRSAQFCE